MRAVGYLRVSTEEQGRSGLGLEAQRRSVAHAADLRGWRLAEVREEVASGGRADNRPELQAALASVGKGDALVVARLDRLSRSLVDFAAILERARRGRWSVVALDLGVDTSTAAGEAMVNVLMTFAQFERRLIGERIAAALEAKRATGWSHPNPRLSDAAVQRIRELHLRGLSQRAIAERLNEEGVPAIGQRWYRETVRRVVAG